MRHRLPALVVGILLLMGACSTGSSGSGGEPSDYTPVPDQQLYATIAALPGVEQSDITFNDTTPEYVYVGRVTISPDADADTVLDSIYTTLRQGRYGADISIDAQQNGRPVELSAIKGPTGSIELEKRYGPQT